MSNYKYAIKKLPIKSWIKYWLWRNRTGGTKYKFVLSEIKEGTNFYLENTIKRKFNMFEIYGKTTQNGTPTPENPIPIVNLTGNINEKVQNKNLTKEIFEVKLRVSNSGSNRVVQTATHKVSQIIRVKPSTTYVIDGDFTKFNDGNCRARCFKDFPVLGNTDLTKPFAYATQRFTITTDATTNYIMIYDSQDNKDIVIPNMFVCEQQYADTYIPHAEQNISFPLAQGQVLAQGDYLADDGIHHKKWSEVLDGVNKKIDMLQKYNDVYFAGYSVEKKTVPSTNVIKPLCTHFQGIKNGTVTPGYCYTVASGIRIVLVPTDQTITTVQAFNEWLQEQYNNGTPVEIEYPLAEEVIEPYTEEQQIEYNKIKELYTFNEVTNIDGDANLKIKYWERVER